MSVLERLFRVVFCFSNDRITSLFLIPRKVFLEPLSYLVLKLAYGLDELGAGHSILAR